VLEHNLAVGSVSKRLSHAGIDSKLMIIGSCGFHRQVAQELWFFWDQHSCPGTQENPLRSLQTRMGWVKTAKKCRFSTN